MLCKRSVARTKQQQTHTHKTLFASVRERREGGRCGRGRGRGRSLRSVRLTRRCGESTDSANAAGTADWIIAACCLAASALLLAVTRSLTLVLHVSSWRCAARHPSFLAPSTPLSTLSPPLPLISLLLLLPASPQLASHASGGEVRDMRTPRGFVFVPTSARNLAPNR